MTTFLTDTGNANRVDFAPAVQQLMQAVALFDRSGEMYVADMLMAFLTGMCGSTSVDTAYDLCSEVDWSKKTRRPHLQQSKHQEQQEMLSNQLFSKVQTLHPGAATQITSLLLQLDVDELLTFISDNKDLGARISEAAAWCDDHIKNAIMPRREPALKRDTYAEVGRRDENTLRAFSASAKAISFIRSKDQERGDYLSQQLSDFRVKVEERRTSLANAGS